MSTDKTPTSDDVIRARVAQWCAWTGIDPARLAAIIAEVRALPGVAQHAVFAPDWIVRAHPTQEREWLTWAGIQAPAMALHAVLTVRNSALSYPNEGAYSLASISGSASWSNRQRHRVDLVLTRYADALDAAAKAAEEAKLRDPARKATRDAEVRDARAAAEGIRAIVARLRAETGAVQS